MDAEFAEAALRQSWEVHRQAFGPILEPAFVDDQQARILLITALNHISRRNIKRGMELLKELKPYCIYDDDHCAWAFFVGLCFEMAGAKEQMLQWYTTAGKFDHGFYLPYLKLAKDAHTKAHFRKARNYYLKAIECLEDMSEEEKDNVILGSAYANLTACLTSLHQYSEAQIAWEKAQDYPLQPGAYATAAMLYAAMGNREQVAIYTEKLEHALPALAEQTAEIAKQILNGTHPDFPVDAPS